MSKIVRVTTYSVEYLLDQPMADGVHYMPSRPALLVEVETASGAVGIGESAMYGGSAKATEALIHDVLVPRILGEEVAQPERHWARMMWPSHQLGFAGALPMAVSGLDVAMWDAMARELEVPLFRLLGGHQTRVQAYASAGFYTEGKDADGIAQEFKEYAALGFKHGKMKVGRTPETPLNPLGSMTRPDFCAVSLAEDLDRVRAVKAAVGEGFSLAVDANNAWDVATAIKAGREFDRLGIGWFEEPVLTDDLQGSAHVAATLDTPVSGYETQSTLSGFRDLINARAVDIVQPDVIWSGGITGSRRIAALAYSAGMAVLPHVYSSAVSLVANLHFIAALPNSYLLELDQNPNLLRTHLLDVPVEMDAEAMVQVSERPGLGVNLDRSALERFRKHPARTSDAS
jgi:L-alanine-DL-glutamate epimerase-like enolase superfamily enzyme